NEIAQAEALTGKPFARYWVHNGLVTVGGQKMSKSLGNYVTLKEVYSKYHPDILRLLVLFTHYRSPLDFSWEKMEETKRAYERLVNALRDLELLKKLPTYEEKGTHPLFEKVKETEEEFFRALSEDFNTPQALAAVYNLLGELGRLKNKALAEARISKQELQAYQFAVESMLKNLRGVFGLLEDYTPEGKVGEPTSIPRQEGEIVDERLIELLIEVRNMVRKEKLFHVADYIRDRLKGMGVVLEDTPAGTRWKRQ
ncbi:MAG: DALR domain-containing protein, partial [Aquificaceae bacterium]|nr:class I tRNA ligase family protein [Aquificaceae bacterium]MDW8434141.1 DALR domain-containing protein [Aquificaceae bacterium]